MPAHSPSLPTTVLFRLAATALFCALIFLILAAPAHAIRVKDLVDIQGVRGNQLVGYGLVVGLDGTGDGNKAVFTTRSIAAMLEKWASSSRPARSRWATSPPSW